MSVMSRCVKVPMFRCSTCGSLGGVLYPWWRRLTGNEGIPSATACQAAHGSEPKAKPRRATIPLRSTTTIERSHVKYRGFWRTLRYLTVDPAVARPAVGGPRSVHFGPLCLFNPAVGTRRSFAAPFRSDPSIERGGISATGRAPAGVRNNITHTCMAHSGRCAMYAQGTWP